MKRLLLILFVVMLPLQSIWAAASVYCTHEADASTQHFGHHSHDHDEKTDSGAERSALVADKDCGLCHLGHSCFVNSAGRLQWAGRDSDPNFSHHLFKSSSLTTRPERPKWSVLA